MSRHSGRDRRGPIGGLIGLIGQGVGMAAEYNEHRREQNQLRASQQQGPVELPGDAPSGPRQAQSSQATPSDLPPAYSASADRTEVSLGAAQQLSPNEKGVINPPEDELTDPELTDPAGDSDDSLLSAGDEEDWELDDAITPTDTKDLPSYEESEAMKENETVDDLVRQVIETSHHQNQVEDAQTRAQLPCPVFLPQRRPRKKQRGFVRAYAPVLEDCGIDQDTFMAFLKSLHKSSQASPIFPVIEVSAAIAGFAPSVIAMAVSTVVQPAAKNGAEVQTRARTNDFLDRMNEELFKPAGLYAMIIKYKKDAEVEQTASGRQGLLSSLIRAEKIDLTTNQMIARYNRSALEEGASRGMSERLQNLRLASDATYGSAQMTMASPLIYPALDVKVAHDGPETFKDKTKDAQKFLKDYLDRRAQMEYASQNPDSSLVVPERPFRSNLADPNHPMHSGGLVALVSGGKLTPRQAKYERKRERHLNKDIRRFERGKDPRERKHARKHGESYVEDLHSRINERLSVHRTRLESSTGSLGGRSFSDTSSEHGSLSKAPMYGGGSDTASQHSGLGDRYSARRGFNESIGEASSRDTRRDRGSRRDRRRQGGAVGMVRRIMREDVLYLMIVNMPSEVELAEARQELAITQGHS